MNCIYCKKSLKKYKVWSDWVSRNSHYSCWKIRDDRMKEQLGLQQYIDEVNQEKILRDLKPIDVQFDDI